MNFLTKIFGDPNKKIIKSLYPIVDKINELELKFKKMTDQELKQMTVEFKERLVQVSNSKLHNISQMSSDNFFNNKKELQEDQKSKIRSCQPLIGNRQSSIENFLPEAFAVVREAAKRVLGQRHYDVQLMGGIILHRGQIAEMRTGEGKTLVATLPLYLNALAGKGVHLVTVNDYLSKLGAGWMAPIYYFLGLSTGVIVHDAAYIYDPKFTDQSQYDERLKHFRKIERKLAYECDITYGTNNEFGFDYLRDNMAPDLEMQVQRNLHYAIVDEVDSILIDEARTPLIISAPAEESTDKYYKFAQLVQRLEENTDYNIDEKMRAATLTEAGINKMEKWLGVDNIYVSGGIQEVHHIEQALKAKVLFKLDRDYVIKDGEVIIVDEFTGRLMPGRRYSEGLHQAIEAKENLEIQRESHTLATITFQNYFRMYAKLAGMTGTALTEAEEFSKIYNLETVSIPTNKPMIREDLNDLIYQTERAKFKAVIQDVKRRNKKGQPVLIGTISIEKNEMLAEMMEREGLHPQVLNAKNHEKEARIIAQAGQYGVITIATNMAGRGVDIILGSDIKSLGGLHVIGTERHESRRIDNQLRGRAGRQGDPGSSQFYVSTEDDLMRIFGGDRMKSLMTTLRVPEDMPIENKLISRSIESAQKKVEGNNFDIRKHLLDYDDVLNKHREAIYKQRMIILKTAAEEKKTQNTNNITNYSEEFRSSGTYETGKLQISKSNDENLESNQKLQIKNRKLSDLILKMIEREIEQVVSAHTDEDDIQKWNLKEIRQVISTIFSVQEELKNKLINLTSNDTDKLDKIKIRTNIIEYLVKLAKEQYCQIKKHFDEVGLNWHDIEKGILLRSIDTLWIEHLYAMTHLRQGIGLRGYGQHDPLVEYKKEAYKMYNELNNLIQKQVVYSIFKAGDMYLGAEHNFIAPDLIHRVQQFIAPSKSDSSSFIRFKSKIKNNHIVKEENFITDSIGLKLKNMSGKKIGRNDPCSCNSGKKYKKCCGT